MDVIIPAGGIPRPNHPLYKYTQGKLKALLDIAGKPMIQWVLDALSEAKSVGHVAVVGLALSEEVEGLDGGVNLSCKKPMSILPNQYNMVENLRAGTRRILELNPSAEYVMTCTSDIPMVTPEAFDWIAEQAQKSRHEFYVIMTTKQAMEERYPGSKRRTDRFTDIEVRGADITVVEPRIILQSGIADRLKQLRHNTLKQLMFIGFDTLLLIRLRRLDLAGFAKRLAKKHGLDWRPLVCPYPEIAMDVDFPNELELARHVLSKNGLSVLT